VRRIGPEQPVEVHVEVAAAGLGARTAHDLVLFERAEQGSCGRQCDAARGQQPGERSAPRAPGASASGRPRSRRSSPLAAAVLLAVPPRRRRGVAIDPRSFLGVQAEGVDARHGHGRLVAGEGVPPAQVEDAVRP
jgi:hypothetical protein